MITLFLVFYAFMAGMTAEYAHTRIKALGIKGNAFLASVMAAVLWPWFIIGGRK